MSESGFDATFSVFTQPYLEALRNVFRAPPSQRDVLPPDFLAEEISAVCLYLLISEEKGQIDATAASPCEILSRLLLESSPLPSFVKRPVTA